MSQVVARYGRGQGALTLWTTLLWRTHNRPPSVVPFPAPNHKVHTHQRPTIRGASFSPPSRVDHAATAKRRTCILAEPELSSDLLRLWVLSSQGRMLYKRRRLCTCRPLSTARWTGGLCGREGPLCPPFPTQRHNRTGPRLWLHLGCHEPSFGCWWRLVLTFGGGACQWRRTGAGWIERSDH
jgi:hypothetical protein